MKTALLGPVLTITGPAHLHFAVLGQPLSVPAAWLILPVEAATFVVVALLAVRSVRRSCSSPWWRYAGAAT